MSRILLSVPHMGREERELLLDAFDSNWVAPLGPHVDAFEEEFAAVTGAPHAAALSSGTAAQHLALVQLGVGAGDEVWMPSLTFCATANACTYLGATPVFLDSERTTWNLDPALLAEALEEAARAGRLPKAVVVVHLYGQPADMDPIVEACARHEVPLVEDAAEALGATHRGRHAGTIAPIGFYSFNGNKIITCSGGGMLVSHDAAVAERTRFLATQARDPAPHYQHSTVGYNYRLSNLLAAVGRGQLRHLDDRVAARRANFDDYRARLGALPGVRFLDEPEWSRCTRWLTVVLVDADEAGADREDVRKHLDARDVEARPLWKPMHLQPVFRECRMIGGAVCEDLFARGLCLPSSSSLTADDRARVMDAFVEALPAAVREG